MIFPIVDNTFVQSSIVANFLITFFAHVLRTCHKHKKKFGPWLWTLLHENTSTIEISFCNTLIKCLWMSIWHEINHAMGGGSLRYFYHSSSTHFLARFLTSNGRTKVSRENKKIKQVFCQIKNTLNLSTNWKGLWNSMVILWCQIPFM